MFGIYEKDNHVHLCILGICVKFKKSLSGKNNKILIKSNGKVLNCRKRIKGLDILINGNDNTIIIETPYKFNCSRIICKGNNNTIIIGGTKYGINSLFIDMRVRKNNRTVNIGKNTKIIGANLHALSDSSSIEIGENCLLSWGIEIMNGDAHKIYDMKTQQVINQGGYCKIGNHVWIGCRSVPIFRIYTGILDVRRILGIHPCIVSVKNHLYIPYLGIKGVDRLRTCRDKRLDRLERGPRKNDFRPGDGKRKGPPGGESIIRVTVRRSRRQYRYTAQQSRNGRHRPPYHI